MNADDVIDAWRNVGADDDQRSLAIHPSGADEKSYRDTGRAAALDVVRLVHEHGDNTRDPIVVDYGCGDGRVAHELARIEPAWRVLGVDASPEMVAAYEVRGEALRSPAGALTWSTADPWPVDPVDVVYSLAVFIHHDHAAGAAMLDGLAGIVVAGGLALIDAPIYDEARERTNAHDVTTWTADAFTAAADRAGFDAVALSTSPGAFRWDAPPGPGHGFPHVLRRR